MALKRFNELAAAAALAGTEIVPVTQSGSDVQTTAQAIANLAWTNGDKGDITVSGVAGSVLTVDDDAITYAKMQNVSATDKLLGRSSGGAGNVEEITCTAAGRALLDDADEAAQRTTLGLALEIPQNSQSAAYTLVLGDSGKHIYHPAADTTARIWTIPSNASVAFPIGTAVTFDNDFGAGAITIAITSDTLVLVGPAGATGSRTLASGGQATAIKVTSTRWRINGTGLT